MSAKRKTPTPDTYAPEYRLLHKALQSEQGLKLEFLTHGKAANYRQRLHTARAVWRQHQIHLADSTPDAEVLFDEIGGIECPFDVLVITLRQEPEYAGKCGIDKDSPAELYITKEPLGVLGLVSVTLRDTGEKLDLTPKLPKKVEYESDEAVALRTETEP